MTGFKISFHWLIFSLSFFNERRLFVVWAGRNFMRFSRIGESIRKRSVITWRGQIDSKLARMEIGVQSGSTYSRFLAERNFIDEKWEGCFAVTMSISRCRQQLTNPKSWARKLNNRLWCKDWVIFRSCFIAVRSRMFVCLFVDSANKGRATCTEISTDDQVSGNEKASEADVWTLLLTILLLIRTLDLCYCL